MAGPKPQDVYQGYNASPSGIADTDSPAGRGPRFDAHANPDDFGAQVGGALQGAGKVGEQLGDEASDIATHYAEMASQAHADDIISNQLVPATAKISSDYYQTKGMDAQKAYQPTLDALNQAQENAIKDLPPIQQNLVRSFSVRHISNLQDGMARHLDEQQTAYEKQGVNDFVDAQGSIAVGAGSNSNVINQAIQSAVGKSTLYATSPTGGGVDPNDPQGKVILDENARQITGKITQQVVGASVARGDISFANSIYLQNKDALDGVQQVEIEKTLHAENLKNTAASNVAAINAGQPLPPSGLGGASVVQVKSAVASAAQAKNVDPNLALMTAGLESSFGRTSDNIGQVQGVVPANKQDSANIMVDRLNDASVIANKLFNGSATPAQIYTIYQQGVGGGPALFNNPDKKAVDVLAPFKSPTYDPVQAIAKNGGRVDMTAKQFTDFIQSKCDAMYGQVKCDTVDNNGNKIDLGKAILAPHQMGGITQQPAANPLQAYQNYDLSGALQQANAIQNVDERNATIEGIKAHFTQLKEVADQYKNQNSAKIQDVTANPDFYSITDPRITPDMRTFMANDKTTMDAAISMAKINREAAGKPDPTKYGSNYAQVQEDIINHKITDYSQLNDYMKKGMLNGDGVKQAKKDIDEEYNVKERKAAAYGIIKAQILGYADNKGSSAEKLNTVMSMLPQIELNMQNAKPPISPMEYYDPSNKNWIGNAVKDLSVPKATGIVESATNAPKVRSIPDVLYDASKVQNDPDKLKAYMEEAKAMGWKPSPAVPLAGGQ